MKLKRRSFLAALAGLPIVGRFFRQDETPIEPVTAVYDYTRAKGSELGDGWCEVEPDALEIVSNGAAHVRMTKAGPAELWIDGVKVDKWPDEWRAKE